MATTKNYLDYAGLSKYNELLKTFVAGTYVAKKAGESLMTTEQANKLAGIAEGAQVNVIESISVKGNGGGVTKIDPVGKGVTIDISAYALSSEVTTEVNRAKGAESSLGGRIDDLFTPAHDTTPASGSVVTYVASEIKKVNDAASTLAGKVTANENAITLLNGSADTEGSVANKVKNAIANVVAGAPTSFDTLKEIADWIENDTTGAAKMANDIATLKGEGEGSVKKALQDAKNYTDAEKTRATEAEKALAGRLDVIEGGEAVEGSVAKALKDAKTYTDVKIGTIPAQVGETATSTVIAYVDAKVAETASGELNTRLTAVESKVGDSTKGLVKDVADLKTTVGDSNSGLVKGVADNKTAIAAVDRKVDSEKSRAEGAEANLQEAIDAIGVIPLEEGENSIASLFKTTQPQA